MASSPKDLPFDQYSRQKIVADLINCFRQGSKNFTVLDVGGYKGKTKEFLPSDKTTVLDVFDVKEDDYIKGDGTDLKVKDGAFDFVVSFDVLEHIPQKSRERFIQECSRAAKEGFFLCCPFENGQGATTNAEKNLNQVYKHLKNSDHEWLKEHIDNQLPTTEAIEAALKRNKLHFTKRYSNTLENWVAMQMIFFYSDTLGVVSTAAGALNRYYNENLYGFEDGVSRHQAYRVIYFISKDDSAVENIKKCIKKLPTKNGGHPLSLSEKIPTALTEIFKRKTQSDTETIKQLKQAVNSKDKDLDDMRDTIIGMRGSLSWRVTKPLRHLNKIARRN